MKILVADDHAIVRRGIKQIILDEFPFAETAEAADAEELVKKAFTGQWDVIITDLSMPGRRCCESPSRSRHLPVLSMRIAWSMPYSV